MLGKSYSWGLFLTNNLFSRGVLRTLLELRGPPCKLIHWAILVDTTSSWGWPGQPGRAGATLKEATTYRNTWFREATKRCFWVSREPNLLSHLALVQDCGTSVLVGKRRGATPTSAAPLRLYREGWTSGCCSVNVVLLAWLYQWMPLEVLRNVNGKWEGVRFVWGFFLILFHFLKKLLYFTKLLFQQEISLRSLIMLLPFTILFSCFLCGNILFLPCMYLILVVFQYF